MDAYAMATILACKHKTTVYYAGMSHTHNLQQYCLQHNLATLYKGDDTDVVDKLRLICGNGNIQHFETLLFPNTMLILVGEDHKTTSTDFGNQLIALLQTFCKSDDIADDMLFMIEKHISNNRDPIQRELTCNQPDMAIHVSRCHEFIDDGFKKCNNLDIVAVDNRHTDMGFLRVELLDLWNDNEEFKSAAQEFQQAALLSMYNFCETLLVCNEMRR